MTNSLDTKELEGKSISEVQGLAEEKVKQAQQCLMEASSIFGLCSKQKIDKRARGRFLQRHWEVEKMRGNQPLFMSQAGQDKFIYERFFGDQRKGLFVEIGGFNGWAGSNSYFFEKTLGWSGVIVEASPTKVKRIRQSRHCQIVHAAISDQDGEAEFIDILSGYTQMGGLLATYSEDLLDKVRQNPAHEEEIVTVPTMRFDTLLKNCDISHVDYCSVDVEGTERAIIETIDFETTSISTLSIENSASQDSDGCADLLAPFGYKLVDIIGFDEIYSKI